ncbi:hypothetical protein TWF225_005916 [Orbilia oligospora]|nr:hypothetical protein TWF225_005916 [Orbilia oligospora]KAF3236093.1 hypothetical protein TWF128_001490 [Orbilia oligospora]KAF3260910.1 hypothetical protein TWF217_004759 [Orbilia oligospora]KAF3278930.1 hypothetical protein TWF132_000814 [Orbilia oligospora]
MSLCSRAVLQAGRPRAVSKPTLLYLRRQLSTEVQSPTPPFHESPSSPPPPVDTASSSSTPQDAPAQSTSRRKIKSKHEDGLLHTLETMPYKCYQEALKILREDREEKLVKIAEQEKSIAGLKRLHNLTDSSPRIVKMQEYIDELKLNMDKNNPRIKYTYDNKLKIDPYRKIYQHWDDQKWRSLKRKLLMQRVEQMNVVPDILPSIDPIIDVSLRFRRKNVPHGAKVLAKNATRYPSVQVKQFDSKKRLVTVLVVDPDKPNLEKNGFDYYLQWMVTNCDISIENPMVVGVSTSHNARDEVAPYEVPYVHKGENYHRYCLFILEQNGTIEIPGKPERLTNFKKAETKEGETPEAKEGEASLVEAPKTKETVSTISTTGKSKESRIKRLGFNLRSFIAKHDLKVIGADIWRVEFDNTMIDVMKQLGRTDWDMKYLKHSEHI